jgi:hypothetical protein
VRTYVSLFQANRNSHDATPLLSFLFLSLQRVTMPTKRVLPVTYQLSEGQSLLIGGFARVDHTAGRPFMFTVVVARHVTVHVCKTANVARLMRRHAGQGGDAAVLAPPFTRERVCAVSWATGFGEEDDVDGDDVDDGGDDDGGAATVVADEFDLTADAIVDASEDDDADAALDDDEDDDADADTNTGSVAPSMTLTPAGGDNNGSDSGSGGGSGGLGAAAKEDGPPLLTTAAVDYKLRGSGWFEPCADIVVPGLGWVATTGAGDVSVRVFAPQGVAPSLRPPLLHLNPRRTTRKFTGSSGKKGRAR